MHILNLLVENYKRIKLVEIPRKGRLTEITGKNGQGKTSTLDSIWSALAGKRGFPDQPVRKGAHKARIRLELDDLVVTRVIKPTGTNSLVVETRKGVQMASPQAILDELIGERTADPQAWVRMKPKEQAEMLRKLAKVDYDFDGANAANAADYEKRLQIGRDVKRLEGAIGAITVQTGLPKERVDEAPILEKLNGASAINLESQRLFKAKGELEKTAEAARVELNKHVRSIELQQEEIAELEKRIESGKRNLEAAIAEHPEYIERCTAAAQRFENAPVGELVDVTALTQELQQAQLINREIDKRARREELETQLRDQCHKVEDLSRAMDRRLEEKMSALSRATLPVPGLTVDEEQVLFEGIPVAQLGEGEQIRIGARILMAQNPKLRVIFIPHGEALDDDSMEILAEMAEQNDFDIWIAKVDSSGKVGVVIEDGMVAASAG